jgi:hypothetical protein
LDIILSLRAESRHHLLCEKPHRALPRYRDDAGRLVGELIPCCPALSIKIPARSCLGATAPRRWRPAKEKAGFLG